MDLKDSKCYTDELEKIWGDDSNFALCITLRINAAKK